MFIISDLLSLVPTWSSNSAPTPTVGQQAPEVGPLKWPLPTPKPLLLVVVRHCGCPFAERDVHQLVDTVLSNPSRFEKPPIQILIVAHTSGREATQWFSEVLQAAFEHWEKKSKDDPSPVNSDGPAPTPSTLLLQQYFSLMPDPRRVISMAYGLGSLPTFSSLLGKETWSGVGKLKEEGIINRRTASGSDRWAQHGAFAISEEGVLVYGFAAEKADQSADWESALKSLKY